MLENIPLKYPVVLVHGIIAHDRMSIIKFWGRIPEVLTSRGKNDGLVSEFSARWGNNIIKIEGGISHAEILDFKKKKISGINIPDIYVKIA